MIDTLSAEQRMCVLMFHFENMSISEIAQTMNCSENTVKSRLNYGRKNLKVKVEELQKKGYRLYSVAPIPMEEQNFQIKISVWMSSLLPFHTENSRRFKNNRKSENRKCKCTSCRRVFR